MNPPPFSYGTDHLMSPTPLHETRLSCVFSMFQLLLFFKLNNTCMHCSGLAGLVIMWASRVPCINLFGIVIRVFFFVSLKKESI